MENLMLYGGIMQIARMKARYVRTAIICYIVVSLSIIVSAALAEGRLRNSSNINCVSQTIS